MINIYKDAFIDLLLDDHIFLIKSFSQNNWDKDVSDGGKWGLL